MATKLYYMDITLDTHIRQVRRGEHVIKLTNKEYALLQFLMLHPDEIVSRAMIAKHMQNIDANTIALCIRSLRRKLCAYGEPNVIQTVRCFGYWLKRPTI